MKITKVLIPAFIVINSLIYFMLHAGGIDASQALISNVTEKKSTDTTANCQTTTCKSKIIKTTVKKKKKSCLSKDCKVTPIKTTVRKKEIVKDYVKPVIRKVYEPSVSKNIKTYLKCENCSQRRIDVLPEITRPGREVFVTREPKEKVFIVDELEDKKVVEEKVEKDKADELPSTGAGFPLEIFLFAPFGHLIFKKLIKTKKKGKYDLFK